jgi:F0F1-type ATP synthase membrane subunit c/vacuolar-type H+-ATPase subunit K
MDRVTLTDVFVWAVLLTIFVGLPALLNRSRVRSFHRNQRGECGRCGTNLLDETVGYMEGFRVCSRCAAQQRRSMIVALAFLSTLGLLALVAVGWGAIDDARRGQFGPWWVYVVVLGSGVGLIGLGLGVWRSTRTANQRAAAKDAARVRRYDTGEE